jgi:hypothetical protein
LSNGKNKGPTLTEWEDTIWKMILKRLDDNLAAIQKQAKADQSALSDGYHATEERLRKLPSLKARVEHYTAMIEDLTDDPVTGVKRYSKDVVRFSGGRVPSDDQVAEMLDNYMRRVAYDQYEINELEWALSAIRDREYYWTMDRYFHGLTDQEMGQEHKLDERSVRFQRGKLVCIVRDRLYGVLGTKQDMPVIDKLIDVCRK